MSELSGQFKETSSLERKVRVDYACAFFYSKEH